MASLTQWTWVWVDSRSWWWTERPGVLWFMGSQRGGHNGETELTELRVSSGSLGSCSQCSHSKGSRFDLCCSTSRLCDELLMLVSGSTTWLFSYFRALSPPLWFIVLGNSNTFQDHSNISICIWLWGPACGSVHLWPPCAFLCDLRTHLPCIFLYFFALITEEHFLISPCYVLEVHSNGCIFPFLLCL